MNSSNTSSSTVFSFPLLELPDEVLFGVLYFLDFKSIVVTSRVSNQMHTLCMDSYAWKTQVQRDWSVLPKSVVKPDWRETYKEMYKVMHSPHVQPLYKSVWSDDLEKCEHFAAMTSVGIDFDISKREVCPCINPKNPNGWYCLSCNHVGCSRWTRHAHGLKHYQKTRHHLVVHRIYGVFCYSCGGRVNTFKLSQVLHLQLRESTPELEEEIRNREMQKQLEEQQGQQQLQQQQNNNNNLQQQQGQQLIRQRQIDLRVGGNMTQAADAVVSILQRLAEQDLNGFMEFASDDDDDYDNDNDNDNNNNNNDEEGNYTEEDIYTDDEAFEDKNNNNDNKDNNNDNNSNQNGEKMNDADD